MKNIHKINQQIINEDYDGGLEMGQIIPKEEPTIEEEYLKDELKKYDGIDVVILNKPEEPKQETLEEAAERYAEYENSSYTNDYYGFIAGAEWQQEQIGKSEFLQKLRATLSDAEQRRLIFEQFKNK